VATWTEDIVNALHNIGGSGSYDDIYAEVARVRTGLPPTWKDVVRRNIQVHSSDSRGFRHGRDLFFSVEGLGQGIWGLRSALTNTPTAVDLPHEHLPAGKPLPDRAPQTTYRVLRDTALARKVKLLHRDNCQLCGLALAISKQKTYSEAHHIIPLGRDHNGPDITENIIVLCPNHHALCDYGAIRLDRSQIAAAAGHEISDVSIAYHNDRIYRSVLDGD
jgi:hypothetical protein